MRAVVQRVSQARVTVAGQVVAQAGKGLLILLGVRTTDTAREADWLAEKCANLRIFEDSQGKMNLSLLEIQGEALVVSQFTLYGDVAKGRRPNFMTAAPPPLANELYEEFLAGLRRRQVQTKAGIFQAQMAVDLCNDGPVTIILEKENEAATGVNPTS